MGITGNAMTKYLSLRTKKPDMKQRASFSITEITNQYFRKLLKRFKNSAYLCYKIKRVHKEPTEYYFLLIIHNNKITKIERCVRLCTKGVKLGVNETMDTSKKNST